MPVGRGSTKSVTGGECRRCRAYCDKLIEPRDCVSMGCKFAYSHVDLGSGTEFVGCLRGVYSGEVSAESLAGPAGFGGIKVTGTPMPHCPFTVERAYEGAGESYDCVNRRFFDATDEGPDGLRAFDLRDGLPAA